MKLIIFNQINFTYTSFQTKHWIQQAWILNTKVNPVQFEHIKHDLKPKFNLQHTHTPLYNEGRSKLMEGKNKVIQLYVVHICESLISFV